MVRIPDAGSPGAAEGVPVPSMGSETSADEAERQGAEPVDAPGAPVRQPVVRVTGARRARLLAAPGTIAEPAPADEAERGAASKPVASGPNDDRMLRDVPPHY